MKRFEIKLSPEQIEALREAAAGHGTNSSELVRRCLVDAGIIPDADIQHGGYRERSSEDDIGKKEK